MAIKLYMSMLGLSILMVASESPNPCDGIGLINWIGAIILIVLGLIGRRVFDRPNG